MMLATPVAAQDEQVDGYTVNVPINCTKGIEPLLQLIKKKYGEDIIFMGQSESNGGQKIYTSMWVNPQTATWSYIVVNKEIGHACIVGSGSGFQVFDGPTI